MIGRWLEHSRIYKFGEGDDAKIYIGSGDLLNRNLERRVEAFAEVTTRETREQINVILDALRADLEKSRRMLTNGNYIREEGGEGTSSQEALYHYFSNFRVSCSDAEESADMNTEDRSESEEEKYEAFAGPEASSRQEAALEPEESSESEISIVPETPLKTETSEQPEESLTESTPTQDLFYAPTQEEKTEIPQKKSIIRKIINLFFG